VTCDWTITSCIIVSQVPGLVESTAGGDIPEHNGFYQAYPFAQHQQSSIHLESFSIQNIMRGAPPTPVSSRPQTSSSVGMSYAASASASASASAAQVFDVSGEMRARQVEEVGGRGGSAPVFNAQPPLNLDERVR
jgi:hypothetical protein